MSFNTSDLPISGGVLLAGVIYIGVSLFVTGPMVATRTIEKSDWKHVCNDGITSAIEAQRTPLKVIPRTDCRSLLGGFMPELGNLCDQYGNPDFGGSTAQVLREQERRRVEAEENRLAALASKSESACGCAASIVAQDRGWALHAGTFRIVTPPSVKHLDSELHGALQSSHCAL